MLGPGDPFPATSVRTIARESYALDSTAGRHVVLSFIASTAFPGVEPFLAALYGSGALFDDEKACCFVVSNDRADRDNPMLVDRLPGIRVIWDHDHALARTLGLVEDGAESRVTLRLFTYILDPGQRVHQVIAVEDMTKHFAAVQAAVAALPDPRAECGTAPVLVVPNLIEPQLCAEFIAYAEQQGLEDSGFMTTDPNTGKTIGKVDHGHKRRFDCTIEDERLRNALQARVMRRLVPQIERAFQFKVSRMERYLVACYPGEGGGWFRPHKDNTTLGTAHRKFAVSIALNADYEGGGLRFPEFGRKIYHAPAGGAVVFSCSLLHEAMAVTAGRRLCLLPFLYDEAAAQVRLENARHFEDEQLRRDVIASVLDTPGYFTRRAAADQTTRDLCKL